MTSSAVRRTLPLFLPNSRPSSSFFPSSPSQSSSSQAQFSSNDHPAPAPTNGIKYYSSKASGLISAILHGSESSKAESSALEKEIAVRGLDASVGDSWLEKGGRDTHSKLLTTGTEITEMILHKVKPDKVDDYLRLCSEYYPTLKLASSTPAFWDSNDDNAVRLVGSFSTEIGNLDNFVHILTYPSYKHYTLSALNPHSTKAQLEKRIASTLHERKNQICLEFAFWRASVAKGSDAATGDIEEGKKRKGIYELRTYQLKPGRMLEWEHHWKRGLECRVKFCQPVGAWFSQLGDLHTVHHMWYYPDLHSRKTQREAAWNVQGWADTVFHTVRLVDFMTANVMVPLEYQQ